MNARRIFPLVLAIAVSGCVAQVRGTRVQKPFTATPTGTKVALLGVEVPPWLPTNAKLGDPGGVTKQALMEAFGKSSLTVVDQPSFGRFTISPDTAPQILQTAPSFAIVGQAWPMTALAVGKPPIRWAVLEGPPTLKIDAQSGLISWTPGAAGREKLVLEATNARGKAKVELAIDVRKPGSDAVTPVIPGAPFIAPDQVFASLPPTSGPSEPLWMGATIVGWSTGSQAMPGGSARTTFTADVAYTLWTRGGREVETRRVRVNGIPAASFTERVQLYPTRTSWASPKEDAELRSRFASLDDAKLPVETAQVNADVFAYTFGEHKRWFSAQLDESSPLLKPGIELSNKDDFEGAFKAFSEVATANPTVAGAFFNAGVMCEVLGRDDEASELYKKARGLNAGEGLYVRQQDALEDRRKHQQVLSVD